jgi:DNA-binding MarR family transcriptional regulator
MTDLVTLVTEHQRCLYRASTLLYNIHKHLTIGQYAVLMYLMRNRNSKYISPTVIGNDVGGAAKHSAWASPICKALVKKKLITRNAKGHYRVCKALLT